MKHFLQFLCIFFLFVNFLCFGMEKRQAGLKSILKSSNRYKKIGDYKRRVSFSDEVWKKYQPELLAEMYCGASVESLQERGCPENIISEVQKKLLGAQLFFNFVFSFDPKTPDLFQSDQPLLKEVRAAEFIIKKRIFKAIKSILFKKDYKPPYPKKIIDIALGFAPQVQKILSGEGSKKEDISKEACFFASEINMYFLQKERREKKRGGSRSSKKEGAFKGEEFPIPLAGAGRRCSFTQDEINAQISLLKEDLEGLSESSDSSEEDFLPPEEEDFPQKKARSPLLEICSQIRAFFRFCYCASKKTIELVD